MTENVVSMGGYAVPSVVRPEFRSAFHRIERVANHLKSLKSQIHPWRTGEGCEVIAKGQPTSRERTIHIRYGELPAEWSTIVGDIVQGLRNSLDNAVYGMADGQAGRPLSESEARGLAFPIYGKESLSKAEADIKLVFVPPLVREFIESIQPALSWDPSHHVDLLWVLRELSNVDKHREMHLGVIQVKSVRVRAAEGKRGLDVEQLRVKAPGSVLDNDAELGRYAPLEGIESNLQFDLALDVVFKDPGPVQHRPVVDVLENLNNRIFNIVVEMAARYERVIAPGA